MGNAEIFISFLANLLICGSKHVTLNQRVQGSSPCAPTNKIKRLCDYREGGVSVGVTLRVTAEENLQVDFH